MKVALVFTVKDTVLGTTADTIIINILVPANTSIESMSNLIAAYAKDGKLGDEIVARLTHDLKQAQHHLEKGHISQAIKFISDAINDLNDSELAKGINLIAKDVLINDAKELIQLWQK